jgi:DNA-binding response OmpR family regulator
MVKIAIIEDEAAIAQMYELELTAAGYEVALAANGKLGLELCKKMRPDMILLDLMMPEMDGREMLKQLRATDWGKKTLVMALTNLSQQEAKLELGNSGFDDYAVKAYYTPRQLTEKIKELLKPTPQAKD